MPAQQSINTRLVVNKSIPIYQAGLFRCDVTGNRLQSELKT